MGNLINTALKAYAFPEAEKRDYSVCANYPYFYSAVDAKAVKESGLTEDQKTQFESMLKDIGLEDQKHWRRPAIIQKGRKGCLML
jgi:hypothetical protein